MSQVSGLVISMVVGNGLFVPPGLAYATSGGAALYAWIIATLPPLVILTRRGGSFPGAGGAVGFVQTGVSDRILQVACHALVAALACASPVALLVGRRGVSTPGASPLALLYGGAALVWYRHQRRIRQKLSDAAYLLTGKSEACGRLEGLHALKRLRRQLNLHIMFVIPPREPLLLPLDVLLGQRSPALQKGGEIHHGISSGL